VTRLGKFPPIEQLFTLGSLKENWGKCLYFCFINEHTKPFKSTTHNSIVMFSLKTLQQGGIRTFCSCGGYDVHCATPPGHYGQFLAFTDVHSPYFGAFFSTKKRINVDKKWGGLHFGRFFHKTRWIALSRWENDGVQRSAISVAFGQQCRRKILCLHEINTVYF
jgi:hypothetical protein